jgi:hypothetical protein
MYNLPQYLLNSKSLPHLPQNQAKSLHALATATTTTMQNQPSPETLLANLERLVPRSPFLQYITLVTRIFHHTHTPASCAKAFAQLLCAHPEAVALHNQIAQLTHDNGSSFNLPEIEDEMFNETSMLAIGRPMEARQVVMQYVEHVMRAAEVETGDVDELLKGMDGLEI